MKNRKREFCTSGSVRDEGGNILIYSAARESGGVASSGAAQQPAMPVIGHLGPLTMTTKP
jgi:hypothetical protein